MNGYIDLEFAGLTAANRSAVTAQMLDVASAAHFAARTQWDAEGWDGKRRPRDH